MDKEALADKVLELVNTMTMRALELPEDLRSAFIRSGDRHAQGHGPVP